MLTDVRLMRGKPRKGQVLVLEEMLVFTLGVVIVAGIMFIFNVLNDEILNFVQEGQAEEVNAYVKSYAVSLKSMDCTRCHVTFEIPEEISGDTYKIYGEDSKKRLLIHDNDDMWNEKNLSVELVGISQGDRILQLEFDGGKVFMKGVNNY